MSALAQTGPETAPAVPAARVPSLRDDLRQIAAWIDDGAHVLDLGCGDGALMAYLRDSRAARVYGVEIADDLILQCVRRGLSVIQADLESGLRMFPDRMFDTVVLSQTLQAMHETEAVLREMARVGRQGIVSFPNFGHWRHLASLIAGRMPVSPQMPYQWYDTPNVHLCTPKDFEILAGRLGLLITGRALLTNGRPVNVLPGLRSKLAVYRFETK
ncbi:MAG TPA: methionine biosynthesis protein MetW [Burkholderiaceae bacterium]|jgi:methionine biosynthesis protein MetW|nr:methionine biosynthesis protein MetW [Burkholderiaceae bacterium]